MSGLSASLLRLIAAHIFLHACMCGVRLAAPLLALREGQSPAAVGLLLALFALTQVFLSLPAGRYTDRRGLKRPLLLSVIAAVLGAGMAAIWPVFWVLALSALLTGGATGVASIALQRHVGRAAENPTQLKQVFSWLSIGPAVSNFVGPLGAGLVIDHAGFQAAFALMALLPLLSWYCARQVVELAPVKPSASAKSLRAWDLLREPSMRRLLVVNWLLSACWDVHTFVVPILGHERGYSASVIGGLLGAFAIATAAVRVVLPLIADRLREWAVIAGAMVASALIYGVYPLMQTPITMAICSVALGVALGTVQPMVMSMIHQITPPARHGEALGLRLVVINASSVVMPMLFGLGGAALGVASIFWVAAAMVGAGTRFALALNPKSGL